MDKNKAKSTEVRRINIRLPEYIQDWYKEQGDKYSVPYSNYMAMLLTQIYEKEKEKELVVEFNEMMKTLKDSTGDITAQQMLEEMQIIMKDIDKLEKK